ncbi:MAG: hypothetical protein IPJ24_17555 [bacterium]|nr:hypothetical protein [bacterium]
MSTGRQTSLVNWGCCLDRDTSEIYSERDRIIAQFWRCLRESGRLSVECNEH